MTLHPFEPASEEALFRFMVVSQVLARERGGEKRSVAVLAVAAVQQLAFDGSGSIVGKRTIYRWLANYETLGIVGLEPAGRPPTASSEVLPDSFLVFLRKEKESDPRASLPEMIRRARLLGVLEPDAVVCRQTVWRAACRMNVETKRRKKLKDRDSRRFAYANRMQMLLCDGKHFRAGVDRARRLALFFLDDATRYGLHVVVGTSESTDLFLRGLYEMLQKHGFFDIAYLDRGSGFKSLDTAEAIRKLDALLILGEAGYPPGRGAIERFNLTAENAVLRNLDGRAEVDPDCRALELRLQHYLREVYNHTPHEGIGGLTPAQRWEADDRPLRFSEDDSDLRRRFVVFEKRRVSNDHVVSMDSVDYEVPRGYSGTQIVLHRRLLDPTIAMIHHGRLLDLAPVDPVANATSRRGQPGPCVDDTVRPPPPSAAELSYQKDLGPVVGPDGGYSDPEKK